MNKNLELEMSEFLLAIANNNTDRAGRILSRLSTDNKEKLARVLLDSLLPTLYCLPGGTVLALKDEFKFEVDLEVKLNAAGN